MSTSKLPEYMSRMNIYKPVNHTLTEPEYNTLMEQEREFITLTQAGYMKNIEQSWLKKLKDIYMRIFNTPLQITCKACIQSGMTQIYKKMLEFRANQVQLNNNPSPEAVQESTMQEVPEVILTPIQEDNSTTELKITPIQHDIKTSVSSSPKKKGRKAKLWNPDIQPNIKEVLTNLTSHK